jgi:hypothetical protein
MPDSIVNGLLPARLEDASHAAIATSTPRLNDYDGADYSANFST